MIFLNVAGMLGPVLDFGRAGTDFLATPLTGVFTKVDNFFGFFWHLRDLSAQNEILTRQVEKLSAEVAGLEKARQENRVLREALGFTGETKFLLVPAEVVAWDFLPANESVTLSRGRGSGVESGDAVVVSGGVLVGVITEALEHTSKMELVSASGMVINAEVARGGASGVVRGEHGLGLLFDLVSQNQVIKEGDRVVTSGLGGKFPAGLLIGQIGKIRSSSSELFQKAAVLPATNLRDIRVVFVIKG